MQKKFWNTEQPAAAFEAAMEYVSKVKNSCVIGGQVKVRKMRLPEGYQSSFFGVDATAEENMKKLLTQVSSDYVKSQLFDVDDDYVRRNLFDRAEIVEQVGNKFRKSFEPYNTYRQWRNHMSETYWNKIEKHYRNAADHEIEIAVNKRINITVHHTFDIGGFDPGS